MGTKFFSFLLLFATLIFSACTGTFVQMQSSSASEVGRWLNADTPVIMMTFSGDLADSVIAEHQTGRMWRRALLPNEMNRYRIATSGGGMEKVNVLLKGFKGGKFVGWACNYYYIQGARVFWGWGTAAQPDVWFVKGFSMNPSADQNSRCERTTAW